MDTEISQKDINWAGGGPCARFDSQIAMEHDITILSGKVSREHIHVFISYHPHQNVSKIVQWLKGTSSRVLLQEFLHLRKQLWGRHVWARGYLAVSSGIITDEMIQEYLAEQEGEPIHDESQFVIAKIRSYRLPGSSRSPFKH